RPRCHHRIDRFRLAAFALEGEEGSRAAADLWSGDHWIDCVSPRSPLTEMLRAQLDSAGLQDSQRAKRWSRVRLAQAEEARGDAAARRGVGVAVNTANPRTFSMAGSRNCGAKR